MIEYNKNNKILSQNLRNSMTEPEIILWSKLRVRQIKNAMFYRQKPIGNYIADFCCSKEKLVIELDGGGHYTDEVKAKDKERDLYFNSRGFRVLRFTNIDICHNLDAVLKVIWDNINPSPPAAVLPLQKGENGHAANKFMAIKVNVKLIKRGNK
jgi:very-short-patch-repair endonuclease